MFFFFFSSRRRHTRLTCDWSSDVCSSDLLWAAERKRLEVRLVSAVELDPEVVKRVGEEIERRTGREIELEAVVDDDLLGGLVLRVGNMICDASVRERIAGLDVDSADLAEVGTVLSVADGIARVHGLDNCMALEMLELPHDVTGLA